MLLENGELDEELAADHQTVTKEEEQENCGEAGAERSVKKRHYLRSYSLATISKECGCFPEA